MAGFRPGVNRGNAGKGRVAGSKNKYHRTFKDALLEAFNVLGGIEGLAEWGRDNRTEFYRICGRLIPHEVSGPDGGPIPIAKIIDEHVEK